MPIQGLVAKDRQGDGRCHLTTNTKLHLQNLRPNIKKKHQDCVQSNRFKNGYSLFTKQRYSRTPCTRVLLQKLTSSQLVKKFPAFYGIWRFNTAIITARRLSLCWARSIQSTPWNFLKIHLNIIPHLRLGLLSGLFPSGFPVKTLFAPILSLYVLHAQPNSLFSIWSL